VLAQESDDSDYTTEHHAILAEHAKQIRNEKHTEKGLAMFSYAPTRGMLGAALRLPSTWQAVLDVFRRSVLQ